LNDLYEGDGSVYERLNSLAGDLDRAVAIDGDLESIAGELADAVYRVEDLAARFREYGAGITMDENRLEEIIERLDLLIKLKRKYGGANGTLGDVISAYQSICRKLEAVNTVDDEIESLNLLVDKAFSELKTLVCDLSAQRQKIAGDFAAKVENELTGLEMKGTRFAVELSSVPLSSAEDKMLAIDDLGGVTDTGCDQATFLIAPNVGESLRPLVKIASGGELSRVILALKAILVRVDSLGTVVFDEVDTGVGGSIAEVVGKKIAQLSRYHQVICITHLPQIAKFGRHHYKIEKHVVNDRTATTIFPLGEGERIAEIARMLGGVEITRATLDHAREMMDAT
jgi:DNA repair protein RecN (Recombination protein N)